MSGQLNQGLRCGLKDSQRCDFWERLSGAIMAGIAAPWGNLSPPPGFPRGSLELGHGGGGRLT